MDWAICVDAIDGDGGGGAFAIKDEFRGAQAVAQDDLTGLDVGLGREVGAG